MKYLVLIYSDPTLRPRPGTPQMAEVMDGYRAAGQSYRDAGSYLAGEALAGVADAKSLRLRDGETLVTHGPFADTKEHLGGFHLLDCATMDEALQLATRIPAARVGTIEVRPVLDFR